MRVETDSFHGPRRAVYTALIGNYDQLSPVRFKSSLQFIVFTDIPDLQVKGWVTKQISELTGISPGAPTWMINRYLKMHPHLILPDYQETLYIDSSIVLLKDPTALFDAHLTSAEIAIPLHPERGTIEEELDACLRSSKIDKTAYRFMLSRLAFYSTEGLKDYRLTENGVILRRITPRVIRTMEIWWEEIARGMVRDQLALPYALYKANLAISFLAEGPRTDAGYMTINPHWPYGKKKNFRYYARAISVRRHQSAAYMLGAGIVDRLIQLSARYKYLRGGSAGND